MWVCVRASVRVRVRVMTRGRVRIRVRVKFAYSAVGPHGMSALQSLHVARHV